MTVYERVFDYLHEHPEATNVEISKALEIPKGTLTTRAAAIRKQLSMRTSYEDDPLMQEIRGTYGPGGNDERVADVTATLQSQFRSGESEGREASRAVKSGSGGSGKSKSGTATAKQSAKGNDSREGRTDSAIDQGYGGANGGGRSGGGSLQSAESGVDVDYEAKGNEGRTSKPSGISAAPNAKERKIRQEQEAARIASEQSAGAATGKGKAGIFGWLHSDDKPGAEKRNKDKSEGRNRPFSAKEAEEKREALIDAYLDIFKNADELIYATHKAHNHVDIWSSIDREDAGNIADAHLTMAQSDVKAARTVDGIIVNHAKLKVGLILAPRFYQTFQLYTQYGLGVR